MTEQSLAERLGASHVGLRPDLEVYRHLFRNEPSYVIRDPMTMQSHRFDCADYAIVSHLCADRSLADTFRSLVEAGRLAQDDEEAFYRFILDLHKLAFLNLPVSNEKSLYRRYLAKQRARRLQRIKSFLFVRVPLWNPDQFLDRTARFVRPLFTSWFFAVWLGLLALAGSLVWTNWRELVQPAHEILGTGNLPIMLVSLVLLKVVHEFGHAYACKLRGGAVPEMGVFLIVFTPFAYVDATSSWGFVKRRDRLVVSLAGVYAESIVAILALLVWATTGSSLVRVIAHNVVLLASVVTVVLNINPLMRFDGYYVLSDALEVPNLRERADARLRAALKWLAFGLPGQGAGESRAMATFLVIFGVCAGLYRAVLVLSISLLVTTKAFLLGMAIAVFYVGGQLLQLLRKLTGYLWTAEETAPFRRRAVALSALLLVGLPLGVGLVPLRGRVLTSGQIVRAEEHVLRAERAGFVEHVAVEPGARVASGDLLVKLANPEIRHGLVEAEAKEAMSRIRSRALRTEQPGRAEAETRLARVHAAEVARRRQELAQLAHHAPGAGVVLGVLPASEEGRFVQAGEPVATVGWGAWQVRALLTADELAAASPQVGEEVDVRSSSDPGRTLRGEVLRVAPSGSRSIDIPSLTHLGGGAIPVAEGELEADQPYFEVTIAVAADDLHDGMTAQVRLAGSREPLAVSTLRRLLRVVNRISRA